MASDDAVVYRTSSRVAEATFDPDDETSLAESIVQAIASAADAEPTEMPPLYDAVDLDALGQLLTARNGTNESMYGFQYLDWQVYVSGRGEVCVCDRTTSVDPTPVFGTGRGDQ